MKGDIKMDELCIVQEVGMFGELEVEDPTCTGVKKKKPVDMTSDELAELIAQAHAKNMSN